MKSKSRDERIAAVMAQATARADAQREHERAAYMKASGGLPFPALRAKNSGSIARKPRYR